MKKFTSLLLLLLAFVGGGKCTDFTYVEEVCVYE